MVGNLCNYFHISLPRCMYRSVSPKLRLVIQLNVFANLQKCTWLYHYFIEYQVKFMLKGHVDFFFALVFFVLHIENQSLQFRTYFKYIKFATASFNKQVHSNCVDIGFQGLLPQVNKSIPLRELMNLLNISTCLSNDRHL